VKTARANISSTSRTPAKPKKQVVRRGREKSRVGDWAEHVPSREHIPIQQRMAESIELSSRLSKLPIIGREQAEDVIRMVPEEVVPILQAADIEFVLVGAHGVGGWLAETRATEDVDFVIRVRDARKAFEALLKKMPLLQLEKYPDVWRFKNGEKYVIDLILTRAPLFKRTFRETHEIRIKGRRVNIPRLEAALAMKFASMVGHWRSKRKKHLDAADFMGMVQANKEIDLQLLNEFGETVYVGGGAEILGYIADIRAGKDLILQGTPLADMQPTTND
jgi:hypothetical protein